MEILLIIIAILLGALCLIAFGILSNTSSAQNELSQLRSQLWSLRDNQVELSEKKFQEMNGFLEELKLVLEESNSSLSDIKYIMNVIYKYKLPDEAEQELLNRIKIDNQLSALSK